MVSKVFRLASKENKVINMVISIIPIFVMYDFGGKKFSVKVFGHDISSHTSSLSIGLVIRYGASMLMIAIRGTVMAHSRLKSFTSGIERLFTESARDVKGGSVGFINTVSIKGFKNGCPGYIKHISNFLHGEVLCEV
jgi:hypothetical protein